MACLLSCTKLWLHGPIRLIPGPSCPSTFVTCPIRQRKVLRAPALGVRKWIPHTFPLLLYEGAGGSCRQGLSILLGHRAPPVAVSVPPPARGSRLFIETTSGTLGYVWARCRSRCSRHRNVSAVHERFQVALQGLKVGNNICTSADARDPSMGTRGTEAPCWWLFFGVTTGKQKKQDQLPRLRSCNSDPPPS